MKRFLKYVLIVLCLGIFFYHMTYLYQNLYNQRTRADKSDASTKANLETIADTLETMNRSINYIDSSINNLQQLNEILLKRTDEKVVVNKIVKQIKKDKAEQFILEKKLQMINVYIKDSIYDEVTKKEIGGVGSGVTLKYKDKFYILTAAHLMIDKEFTLSLNENGEKICDLKIVKRDEEADLMLLQPVDDKIVPLFYTELADMEPLTATQVYVVGNPAGAEDIVSEGRVMSYKDQYMLVKDIDTFFGNSGCGIYLSDGKLVGITSACTFAQSPSDGIPNFVVDLEIRLSTIRAFLKDVN